LTELYYIPRRKVPTNLFRRDGLLKIEECRVVPVLWVYNYESDNYLQNSSSYLHPSNKFLLFADSINSSLLKT
jgi:hypothetical protein